MKFLMKLFLIASVFSSVGMATEIQAPGRGVLPQVSEHYHSQPAFYDFAGMKSEILTPKIQHRFIMGSQSTLTRWDLKAGTHLPVHFHINEQITHVQTGRLIVYSQEKKYSVLPGQVMIFPPNVPHEFVAEEDTVIYEFHTPARADFINGDFKKAIVKNPVQQQ